MTFLNHERVPFLNHERVAFLNPERVTFFNRERVTFFNHERVPFLNHERVPFLNLRVPMWRALWSTGVCQWGLRCSLSWGLRVLEVFSCGVEGKGQGGWCFNLPVGL